MAKCRHSWAIAVDPAAPFMADHQPGGNPLLGTVGQLANLSGCGAKIAPGGHLTVIENVSIAAPFIITGTDPRTVDIEIAANDHGSLQQWALSSRSSQETVSHMHATAYYAETWLSAPLIAPLTPLGSLSAHSVSDQQIYGCFFHGPSFRVVADAAFAGTALHTTSVAQLPAWSSDGLGADCGARLIEFGLQSAGLYLLATEGAMLIPKRIGRIERFAGGDVGDGAVYSAQSSAAAAGSGVDITISNSASQLVVRITNYICEPLPFAHDSAAASLLAAQLNATKTKESL